LGQQAQTVWRRGTLEQGDGSTSLVKADEASDVTVSLPDHGAVCGLVQATLADVQPGACIGGGAMPPPKGSYRSSENELEMQDWY
jgi:hypothetical protein